MTSKTKKVLKNTGKAVLIILMAAAVLAASELLLVFVWDKIALKVESGRLEPPGQLVEVDGRNMHVYTMETVGEENENPTIVFLADTGEIAPCYAGRDLEFLFAYRTKKEAENGYRVAVVERFGSGYSDPPPGEQSVGTIVGQYREALRKAGVNAPYIIAAQGNAGYEAFYWAREHAGEVAAILGFEAVISADYLTEDVASARKKELRWKNLGAKSGVSHALAVFLKNEKYGWGYDDTSFLDSKEEEEQYRYLCHRLESSSGAGLIPPDAERAASELITSRPAPDVPVMLISEWRFFFPSENTSQEMHKFLDGLPVI
jgi:pimeloyl-ACP methyl ester carboxylesterase